MQIRYVLLIIFTSIFFEIGYSQWNIHESDQYNPNSTNEKYEILFTAGIHLDEFNNLLLAQRSENIQIPIPFIDGKQRDATLRPYKVFDDELSQKYPKIKSFIGSLTDSNEWKIFLTTSPEYINITYISTSGDRLYLDPITLENGDEYIMYKPLSSAANHKSCLFYNDDPSTPLDVNGISLGDCQLRTYRLALSCTGEYAKFFGGTVEKVLAAYNNSVTRVNSVYENDLAIHLTLVGNTDRLIYLDGNSDPFSNLNSEAMLDENQITVDNVIGTNNYDIGHVFGTGDGGIASLRSVCTKNSKAMGVTGNPSPKGDAFDIDYVCHEMGHQFGGNHTQNNSCQRSLSASYEPGSASTIMGYAGICDPNVQNNSDAYFHNHSINEILNYVIAGEGATCANVQNLEYAAPEFNDFSNEYFVPISTSFYLEDEANGQNYQNFTYCWEQFDRETASMPPASTATKGPAFRSLNPKNTPRRYFPDLQKKYGQWEVLPSVARQMHFRSTVRNNSIGGGCVAQKDVTVNFVASAGPFVVTDPNLSNVKWYVGSKQVVKWNVANTDAEPINAKSVNIYLSKDGGLTYPILLAQEVPNSGSAEIVVPNIPTTAARVMVEGLGNRFFDVSNQSFKILNTFTTNAEKSTYSICEENDLQIKLYLKPISNNVVDTIRLFLTNVPTPVSAQFLGGDIVILESEVSQDSAILHVENLSNLPLGSHTFEVIARNGSEENTILITLDKGTFEISNIQIIGPDDGAIFTEIPLIAWQPIEGVSKYEINVSNSNLGSWAVHPTTDTTGYATSSEGQFFWRVKPISACADLPASEWRMGYLSDDGRETTIVNKNDIYVTDRIGGYTLKRSDLLLLDTFGLDTRIYINRDSGQITIYDKTLNIYYQNFDYFTYNKLLSGDIMLNFSNDSILHALLFLYILDHKGRWKGKVELRLHRVLETSMPQFGYKIIEPITCFDHPYATVEFVHLGMDNVTFILNNSDTVKMNSMILPSGVFTTRVVDQFGTQLDSFQLVVPQPPTLNLDISQMNYNLIASATGGLGDISFKLDQGDLVNENVFSNISNGIHEIQAIDELGCKVVKSFEVNILPLTLDFTYDTIKCSADKTSLVMHASGGVAPYYYSLDGGAFQPDSVFLVKGGMYTLAIKDAGDKMLSMDSVMLIAPTALFANTSVIKYDCVIAASGGTPPYQYSFNDIDFQSNDTLHFAGNGSYKVYIKDNNGCRITRNITINVFNALNPNAKNITCYGANDGSVKFVYLNGTAPFNVSFSGSTFSTNRIYANLPAGDYDYVVYDSKSDTVKGSVTIIEPDSLELDISITGNGFTLQGIGGTPPYTYSIDNGKLFIQSNEFNSLPDGEYHVAVKDNSNCITYQTVTLTATESFDNAKLIIVPNPTSGQFHIQNLESLNGDVKSIQLLDTYGRIVLRMKAEQNVQSSINIKELPSGAYWVNLIGNTTNTYVKLIKI
ncbi:MAG: T9SS type A sorting domain-containing protein [Lewinellaceae bacterium]|nr:T9SS type A sorting domain-containing protein [Lewinellaceae bacterium]